MFITRSWFQRSLFVLDELHVAWTCWLVSSVGLGMVLIRPKVADLIPVQALVLSYLLAELEPPEHLLLGSCLNITDLQLKPGLPVWTRRPHPVDLSLSGQTAAQSTSPFGSDQTLFLFAHSYREAGRVWMSQAERSCMSGRFFCSVSNRNEDGRMVSRPDLQLTSHKDCSKNRDNVVD